MLTADASRRVEWLCEDLSLTLLMIMTGAVKAVSPPVQENPQADLVIRVTRNSKIQHLVKAALDSLEVREEPFAALARSHYISAK